MRDATNLQVGTFVGLFGFTLPSVIMDAGGQLFPILVGRQKLMGTYTVLYFDTAGCTGQAYTDRNNWNGQSGTLPTTVVFPAPGGFTAYLADDGAGPVAVITRSYLSSEDNLCRSENRDRQLYPLLPPVDLFFTAPFRLEAGS